MCSSRGNAALPALGCPIRESTDHRLFNAYPWLFAVVHALLRLQMPRHPPCALTILTVIAPDGRKSLRHGDNHVRPDLERSGRRIRYWLLCSLQGPRGERPAGAPPRPVSQNPTARDAPVSRGAQVRSTFLEAGVPHAVHRGP